MAGQVVVATAGWSVKEWYDEGVEPRERLRALAAHLDGVEVDSSFYALPSASTVQRWAEITPDGFTFAAKLHRARSRHAAPPAPIRACAGRRRSRPAASQSSSAR